jgi:signal transduction histidine kinase
MSNETEVLRENFALILRLKEQAEALRKESDMLLSGMRDILSAQTPEALYQNMFEVFASLIPYQICFILSHDTPGYMVCKTSTTPAFLDTKWPVDDVLKRTLIGTPTAVFNARIQPAWQALERPVETPAAVLYCPFIDNNKTSIIAFCSPEIGFYTQTHINTAERYREFTEQTLMSVQAKLDALESQKLKKEREQVQLSMVQSEKMASLGLLAAGVAHEINNPLAFVNSNFDALSGCMPALSEFFGKTQRVLKTQLPCATKLQQIEALFNEYDIEMLMEDLQEISADSKEGIHRVCDIVKSLQAFTQDNDADDKAYFDLNNCVDDSLRLLKSKFKNTVQVTKKLNTIPLLKGSQGKVNQVLVNLMVNAYQAMASSAHMYITTGVKDTPNIHNLQSALDNGAGDGVAQNAFVKIIDNGCGIAEDKIDSIFEPFFTTKPVGEGTGLGLYITYTLVQALGGEITVDSELNVGTEFTLTFPIPK